MRIRTAVRKNSGKPDGIGKSSGNRRKIQSAQSRQNTGFPDQDPCVPFKRSDPSECQDMEQGKENLAC